jgi:hypothetical protein
MWISILKIVIHAGKRGDDKGLDTGRTPNLWIQIWS